jgi:hypothetical protein
VKLIDGLTPSPNSQFSKRDHSRKIVVRITICRPFTTYILEPLHSLLTTFIHNIERSSPAWIWTMTPITSHMSRFKDPRIRKPILGFDAASLAPRIPLSSPPIKSAVASPGLHPIACHSPAHLRVLLISMIQPTTRGGPDTLSLIQLSHKTSADSAAN